MSKDKVMPKGPWTFDEEVTDAFDNMLQRSVPQYKVMRESCYKVACYYAQPDSTIVDLGCSRGEALAKLLQKHPSGHHYLGIETADPMLKACRDRFQGFIDRGIVEIRKGDLRESYPQVENVSVTLCILTLQFIPIEYRQRLLQNIYDTTSPGGALILVEKVLGNTSHLNEMMVETYYDMKSNNGYTSEQIDRKRLSLEGVLVPVTAAWNEDLLKQAGFREVDCFWRWMNFAAWAGVK